MKKDRIHLIHFDINGLFGDINYSIPIIKEKNVTAIIAPNGSGKTLCLRLINSLFQKKWSTFYEIDFKKIKYIFTGQISLEILKHTSSSEEGGDTTKITLYLKDNQTDQITDEWTPKKSSRIRFPIERYLPFITRINENLWSHDHTGQIYEFHQLIDTYRDKLPKTIIDKTIGKIPESINNIIDSICCRLIETQRLLVLKNQNPHGFLGHSEQASKLAITEKAESLQNIISSELNKYAELSQSLDRSFPHRLINGVPLALQEDISNQLSLLDDKRKELMKAGILDAEVMQSVILPTRQVDEAIARVLQVHINDNNEKLASLYPLLKKINLFKKLIDQRFITKDVRISKSKGIEVITKHGEIPLDKLSSGEQHQLVLFFELLFEIQENSLILIDEPELSLHVAWQKKFIGDLLDIINLNKFDVILATHSPQLISQWDDLVVELGDVYADEYREKNDKNP